MKNIIVIIICFSAIYTSKAQKNPLINPQINEINPVKHDSLRLFTERWTGLFKSKIIPAQDLFSSKQLYFSNGAFFTYDTIKKPVSINYYYGNLKPVLKTDSAAFSLYRKARIYKYTSDAFFVAEAGFLILTINRWAKNTPSTYKENTKTKILIGSGFGCLLLSSATQYISRHYLNKSIKKFNENAFPY